MRLDGWPGIRALLQDRDCCTSVKEKEVHSRILVSFGRKMQQTNDQPLQHENLQTQVAQVQIAVYNQRRQLF